MSPEASLTRPTTEVPGQRSRYRAVIEWAKDDGKWIFGSWDFRVGLIAGVVAGGLAAVESVRNDGVTILLAEFAGGIALAAVVFTALAIIATFFDSSYRKVLEVASGSVRAALLPYAVVGIVSSVAALVALIVALAWPALPAVAQAPLFGIATLFAAWAIVGCVQLFYDTVWHAMRRAELMRGVELAQQQLRRKRSA